MREKETNVENLHDVVLLTLSDHLNNIYRKANSRGKRWPTLELPIS